MKLQDVLSYIPFYKTEDYLDDIHINGIEMDSRSVKDGDLFVCINGFTVDGHDYVQDAIKSGASAIISEKSLEVSVPVIIVPNSTRALSMIVNKYYDNPTEKLSLIGVTGTNGKTTITYLLEAIFNAHEKKTGVIGTIHIKIGEQVIPVENTTPDALVLQQTFNEMVKQDVDTAIMEVSSHALDLGRVYGTDFDVAIFTNLSQDHLDYHEDMNQYLFAKSLLFSQLGNTYNNKRAKYAILNKDDANCSFLEKVTAQSVLTYSRNEKADVYATDIKLEVTHTQFQMHTPVGSVQMDANLIGMFNVSNMLAASAAAITQGIPLETIQSALNQLAGVDGRFEAVRAEQDFAVIVDYAHTPDSLLNVLETIQEFAKAKIYVVTGCGGDRDRSKRPLMAEIAVKYADHAIFTSDNPRTENPKAILEEMIEGIDTSNYTVIENRKDAIEHVVNLAQSGDIILIAGKGHETYQIIGKTKQDFDDRVIARIAIQKKVN